MATPTHKIIAKESPIKSNPCIFVLFAFLTAINHELN